MSKYMLITYPPGYGLKEGVPEQNRRSSKVVEAIMLDEKTAEALAAKGVTIVPSDENGNTAPKKKNSKAKRKKKGAK